jgi:lysophospholipase L1-like esterase
VSASASKPGAPLAALALAVAVPILLAGSYPEHYTKRLARFGEENAALAPDARTVVFLGDSITEGFPLGRYFPDWPALNRGISADRIGRDLERGVLRRLEVSVEAAHPAVVLLLIGVNDLAASGRAPSWFVEGVDAIVTEIRERCPDTRLVLQTCLPVGTAYWNHAKLNPRITEFNQLLRHLAKRRDLPLIDLHALYRGDDGRLPPELSGDGLHLRAAAYLRWAEAVRAAVTRPESR